MNNNNGTLINGPAWITGTMGNAVEFDGNNDRISCGSGAEMDMGTGDFSISTWIKMGPQTNSYPTFISKGGGNTTDVGYWVFYKYGVVWLYLSDGTTRLKAHSVGVNLTDDAWHHVAITIDRDGNITFYADGIDKGTADVSAYDGQNITSSSVLNMGSWVTSSFSYLDGAIDDTRLFDVALSPDEVLILAGGTPGENFPPEITTPAWATPNPVVLPDDCVVDVDATDPNGDPLTYTWSLLSGPAGGVVTFTPNPAPDGTSTASFSLDGIYDLRVSVSDGVNPPVTSDVEVTVNPYVNYPPDLITPLSATPNPVILPNTTALEAEFDDPNGDPLTYNWSVIAQPAGSTVTFTSPNPTTVPTNVASFSVDGVYTLRVEAFDGLLTTGSDVVVNVQPAGTLPDPIAHWPITEGSGATTEDVSINDNDGTFKFGAYWTTGLTDFAVGLDGVNDRVECGPSTEMDMSTGDFSISTWIKMGSQSNTYPTLISKGGGSATNEGYWVFYRYSVLWLYLSNGSTRLQVHSTGVALADNNWHHVVLTLKRDGDVTFYVDGVDKGTADISTFNGQDISSSNILTLGSWQSSSFSFMSGSIDDTKLFDAELSAGDVSDLYDEYSAYKSIPSDMFSVSDITVYPNPFKQFTNISFAIEQEQQVVVSVFNIHGEVIKEIHNGNLYPGGYSMMWDGTGQYGMNVQMGVYIIRVVTANDVRTKTIIRRR